MHYQFTSAMLLGASLLVASNMGFGSSSILCVGHTFGHNDKDVESYCMNYGFKLLRPSQEEIAYQEYPRQDLYEKDIKKEVNRFNGLFKWMSLILLAQSVLFYFPHLVWKTFENGWIATLIGDLKSTRLADFDDAKERIGLLAKSFLNSKLNNQMYVCVLLSCEVLNFINIFLQLYIMNLYLNNYLMENPLGLIGELHKDANERFDPLELAFPKVISCPIYNYGVSGTVEIRSRYCEVPINYTNELFFILSAYWLSLLFLCTAIHIIFFRLLPMLPWSQKKDLQTACKGIRPRQWNLVFRSLGLSDLFVLRVLIGEMNRKVAEDFIYEIANSNKTRPLHSSAKSVSVSKDEETPV